MEDERLDNQIEEASEPVSTAGAPPAANVDGDRSQDELEAATGPIGDEAAESAAEIGAAAAAVPSRRPLKLVLDLRPSGEAGYRALLAVGSDGCDPLMRSIYAADMAEALQEVPGLIAAAEERWATSPRYPATATPAKKPVARPQRAPTPPPPPPAASEPEPVVRPEPAVEPASGSRDQLSLFG